mmetsp:Transcript_52423/g.97460  ORF Transcript_52423/g.97460 Transcript_52423/m.97460 type:complete len:223 (-) Transcript_52423:18-686(-)
MSSAASPTEPPSALDAASDSPEYTELSSSSSSYSAAPSSSSANGFAPPPAPPPSTPRSFPTLPPPPACCPCTMALFSGSWSALNTTSLSSAISRNWRSRSCLSSSRSASICCSRVARPYSCGENTPLAIDDRMPPPPDAKADACGRDPVPTFPRKLSRWVRSCARWPIFRTPMSLSVRSVMTAYELVRAPRESNPASRSLASISSVAPWSSATSKSSHSRSD